MENAVDALKIAFAVMVFSMALSLTMYMFSQARETADAVLHSSDITEFVEYDEAKLDGSGNITGDARVVGLESIVPTLYKYYKENYTVVFREADGNYMPLFESQSTWQSGYTNKYFRDTSKEICSFDVEEETKRNEPWTGSREEYKKNIDAFLSGEKYTYTTSTIDPDTSLPYTEYDYSNFKGYNGFIEYCANTNAKFIETLGEYTYNEDTSDNAIEMKKRVIIYTLDS